MKFGILLTCRKHLHYRVIPIIWQVWTYQTSLSRQVLFGCQVSERLCICLLEVSSQVSERLCICLLGVSILPLSNNIDIWFWNCFDGVVLYSFHFSQGRSFRRVYMYCLDLIMTDRNERACMNRCELTYLYMVAFYLPTFAKKKIQIKIMWRAKYKCFIYINDALDRFDNHLTLECLLCESECH